jgi:RNA polymerase primary sigma factor
VQRQLKMSSARVQQVLEALLADYERQEGRITIAQIERLVLKRELSPLEVRDVFKGLAVLQIQPEEPEQDQSAPESDEMLPSLSDGLDSVIRSARARELLTRNEEVELGRRIKLAQQARNQTLETDNNTLKYDQIIQRGESARDRLVKANLLLVLAWARKYEAYTNFELADLFQEGVIGLMKAVERYDPELGLKFSTYAVWWIQQAITRALADRERMVRLPVHRVEQVHKFKRAVRFLQSLLR